MSGEQLYLVSTRLGSGSPFAALTPASGCLWVLWQGAAGAPQGQDLDFGVRWSWGWIPALTLTGVTWGIAVRPLGAVPG